MMTNAALPLGAQNMQVFLDKASFLRALTHAQGVVEKRTTVPILSHVLINTKHNAVELNATDLELSIIESFDAETEAGFSLALPAHTLYDIVRKLSDRNKISLQIFPENQQVELVSGKSRFMLSYLSGDEFPVMAQESYPHHFKVSSAEFKRILDQTRFAMSNEETRYYLNGIYLHSDASNPNLLIAVATDGHRLAKSTATLEGLSSPIPGVILSRKTISELRKILDETDQEIHIGLSENKISFICGSTHLTSRLIDGTFPDYDRVIPQHNDKIAIVSASLFSETVDRVSIISSDKSRAVKLVFDNSKLTVSAVNVDNGSAEEDMEISFEGPEIQTGFNSRYLLDVTQQMKGKEMQIFLSDSASPIIVQDTNHLEALYILMPMRV